MGCDHHQEILTLEDELRDLEFDSDEAQAVIREMDALEAECELECR